MSCYRDLNPGPLPYQGSALPLSHNSKRAEDGAQTRDPQLGRLMLYQLSYFRNFLPSTSWQECGQRWIRTTVGLSQQIYSLPHLSTLVFAQQIRASCRIRTNDPEITNHVLWPTELKRRVGKQSISRRYNLLPLLRSSPGGFTGSWPYRTYPYLHCKGTWYF